MRSRPMVSAACEDAICSLSKSGTMELIESLATLGLGGSAAGASGACECKGADASRSSNAGDRSFNFHLVADSRTSVANEVGGVPT